MEKTKLILDPISNGKAILLEEYVYDINGYLIRVPKSFITDGASVPHSLQWLYNPFGKYIKAAIIHDYLYSCYNNTGINRTLADKIFYFINWKIVSTDVVSYFFIKLSFKFTNSVIRVLLVFNLPTSR